MTCHIVTKINTRQQSPADQISPPLLPLHLHNSFNSQMQPSAELGFLLRLHSYTQSLSQTENFTRNILFNTIFNTWNKRIYFSFIS